MSVINTLFYIHDPMCSWCWGYRPTWKRLEQILPDKVCVQYVLGGLAPDTNAPMSLELQYTIQGYWRKIHSELSAEFNFEFWKKCKPRRSTYQACRAVIAAKQQRHELEMIESIQRAYYLRAMNPSDSITLVLLAKELGLDENQFVTDLISIQTEKELQQQIQFVRAAPTKGFPALLLNLRNNLIPMEVNYTNAEETLTLIDKCISTEM